MSETLNVLTKWTYKQKQLVELIPINPNGEITNLTRVQRMAINLFLQTINNQLLLKTVEKDEFGQLVFSIELGEFLDRLGMEDMKNLSYIINQLKELKSIEIVTENKVKFTSFVLFSEVNYDKEKDIIKFVPSLRIVSSIQNGWCNITDGEPIGSNNYVRLHIGCHSNLVGTKNTKVMIMYEIFMSYAKVIKDTKKRYRMDINRLLLTLESHNYNKNSEIINKLLKPIVSDLYEYYGLKMFYKCETSRRYNKISNVSFRVYIDTTNSNLLDSYEDSNGNLIFDKYPPKIIPIFKFKDKKEWESAYLKGLTNCDWSEGDCEEEDWIDELM